MENTLLEHFTTGYDGHITSVKVWMDKNPKTAVAWHVRSAPTLLLFKHGAVQATQVGMASKSQLVDAAL